MQRANRTQHDDKQDAISHASGIDCSTQDDTARQEFKDEADVNLMLGRYGVGLPQKQITYGETDFDLDLQTALEAVNTARTAYRELPPELRKMYPSWQTLLNALETGALKFDFSKKTVPPETPTTQPEQPKI